MQKISDRLWDKAGKLGFPLTGAFELLPLCTLRCKMCYVRKDAEDVRAAGGLIRAGEWLDFAAQAKELGLLFPLLTGGEPLLHPDFREIFTGIQEMGMQVSVNSNGTLIDRETAAWFSRHRPARINLTLYGASEESYAALCGDGDAFRRVHDAVQYLGEFGIPVKFNTSITPENVGELDAIMAYAKSAGRPIQVATYMFPPVRREAGLVGQNDRLTPEEAGLARVRADYLQEDPGWFIGQARRFSRFVPITDDFLAKMRKMSAGELKMSCRAGHCSFWVDWRGNMSNCGMYGSVELPLRGRPLGEVWRELREQTHALRYHPVCAVCPNLRLCHSCVAMVYNECGTFDGWPEYLCRMNQAAAGYYQDYLETYYPDEAGVTAATGRMTEEAASGDGCGCDCELNP